MVAKPGPPLVVAATRPKPDRLLILSLIHILLSFLGGILIDELKANEREYIGFAAVFLAAAVIAAADYAIIRKIPYVEMHPVQELSLIHICQQLERGV